jgi:AraC family transcriptional regulator
MLNDSHPVAAATANFDGDRDRAKDCLWRAAEMLQVGRSQEARRRAVSRVFRGGLPPWQAKRVAAYIEANIDSYFRVADLAGVAQLSISHFSRAFRQTFGETPHTYIRKQQMRRAQLIMLTSREPLARIALDCGMFDQAHFTHVFRKLVGINPSVWRRQFSLEAGARAAKAHAEASQNNPFVAR